MPKVVSTPRVFISYSHDSSEHKSNIADLAQTLRQMGIDVSIDLYVEANPPLSWAEWMYGEIEEADFVLIVFTEKYLRSFRGKKTVGVGLGARWEGAIITSALYFSTSESVKFIPLTVHPEDAGLIPAPLSLTNRYHIGVPKQRDLEPLYRHLTNQPLVIAEPLGQLVDMSSSSPSSISGEADHIAKSKRLAKEGEVSAAREILERHINTSTSAAECAEAAYLLGEILHSDDLYMTAIMAYRRALDYGPATGFAERAAERLEQVIAEMNAHFGPGSAVEAAHGWLGLVKKGRKKKVWATLDRDLRLALAQDWIIANERHPSIVSLDRERLASSLATKDPKHRLAGAFLTSQLAKFQNGFATYDRRTWGAAERPRRFRLDYEFVIFMESGEDPQIWEPGVALPHYSFMLRRNLARWVIASFGPGVPRPGWPPAFDEFDVEGVEFRPEERNDDG